MAEHEEAPFSFTAFAGLDIVCDNARSHAPFETLSSDSSSSDDDEDDEAVPPHQQQPLSPARGLTRWGSQEDLVCSSTPKPPSRTSSDTDSPVNLAAAIPIVTSGAAIEIEANASIGLQIPDDPSTCMWEPPTCNTGNSLLETRIHRIRSRWNSHVTDENNKVTGKVKLSPTLPKRCKDCLEEMKMPALPDIQRTSTHSIEHHHHDPNSKDCISSILSQSEGTLWKGIIRQQEKHAGDPFFPSIVSPSSSSDDRDDHYPSAALESVLDPDP